MVLLPKVTEQDTFEPKYNEDKMVEAKPQAQNL